MMMRVVGDMTNPRLFFVSARSCFTADGARRGA
jgi:hypothetical protein